MLQSKIRATLSVSNIAIWIGLLVDFDNAATRLGSMMEVDALLPVLALGGTAGAAVWLLFEAWTWRPSYWRGQRLKAQTPLIEKLREIAPDALTDATKIQHAFDLIIEAKKTLESQFAIPCPGMKEPDPVNQEQYFSDWLSHWSAFAAVLLPSVRIGDIKGAKSAINELNIPLKVLAQWGREQGND